MLTVVIAGVIIGAVVGYALGGPILARLQRYVPPSLDTLYQSLRLYVSHPAIIVQAVVVSVVYFLIWSVSVWCLTRAIGLNDLGFSTILLILATVNIAQIVPISVNGWGVREGALIVLLSAFNVPSELALLLSLLIAFTSLAVALSGGVLVVIDYRDRRWEKNAPEL